MAVLHRLICLRFLSGRRWFCRASGVVAVIDDDIQEAIASLSDSQRSALLTANKDGYRWRVSMRHPGFRGLTSRGIVYGVVHANRAPGTLGMLTGKGEAVREALIYKISYREEEISDDLLADPTIQRLAGAMRASKAWPAVFGDVSAGLLAAAVLSALRLTPSAASALMDGAATVVPTDLTDQQCESHAKALDTEWRHMSVHVSYPSIRAHHRAAIATSPYGINSNAR